MFCRHCGRRTISGPLDALGRRPIHCTGCRQLAPSCRCDPRPDDAALPTVEALRARDKEVVARLLRKGGWRPTPHPPAATPAPAPTCGLTKMAGDHGAGNPKHHSFRPAPAPEGIEVRDPDDEVVAHGAFVHVERLDDDRVWMSIATPNGQEVHIDVFAQPKRRVGMSVTDQGDTPTTIPAPAEDR